MKEFDRNELAELHNRVVACETAFARAYSSNPRDLFALTALDNQAREASREFWDALYRIEIFPG